MAVCIVVWPLHPSTGQGLVPAFALNAILNVLVSLPPPSPLPSFPDPPFCHAVLDLAVRSQ